MTKEKKKPLKSVCVGGEHLFGGIGYVLFFFFFLFHDCK